MLKILNIVNDAKADAVQGKEKAIDPAALLMKLGEKSFYAGQTQQLKSLKVSQWGPSGLSMSATKRDGRSIRLNLSQDLGAACSLLEKAMGSKYSKPTFVFGKGKRARRIPHP